MQSVINGLEQANAYTITRESLFDLMQKPIVLCQELNLQRRLALAKWALQTRQSCSVVAFHRLDIRMWTSIEKGIYQ
jgi:hypothetical protein